MVKIKPSQKTLVAALSDKTDKVQAYLKSTKVDFKSDRDLAKLLTYYNSL